MPHKDPEERRAYNRDYHRRHPVKVKAQKYRQTAKYKASHSGHTSQFRKRQNQKTQGRLNHSKQWTEQEIALLWNTDYVTSELALLLDRTHHAVLTARRRHASRKPEGYRHNGTQKVQLTLPGNKAKELLT